MARPITRRAMLRYSLLGAAATIVGCRARQETPQALPTALPTSTPAASYATAIAEATPTQVSKDVVRGGTYRMLVNADVPSLDPPGAWWWVDWWSVTLLLYNLLYNYDKDYKLYPDLAADWPKVSDDGLVYTIPLRKGVKFHNGREMTARDVKFTFERAHWPETQNWGKTYLTNIVGYQDVVDGKTKDWSGIKVLDDYTIQFTLQQPQAVFLPLLTMAFLGIVPEQETLAAGADWGTKVIIGTGPFKFSSWETAIKVVYERNPDYFRPELPYLDKIEIMLNVAPEVALLRYDSGECEFTFVPAPDTERLLKDPSYQGKIRTAFRPTSQRLSFNWLKGKPFDDVRVRQAVAHCIDRENMVRTLYSGQAVALQGIYAPGMLQYSADFRSKYQYDPEKARALLAEAGYPDGLKDVKIAVAGPLGELIQADLKAGGIETLIMTGTEERYLEMIYNGEIPIAFGAWSASIPDAYDYVSGWCTCASAKLEGTYNSGMYCNERVDQLLAEAELLPLGSAERIAKYREIEDIIINQDVAMIGLYSDMAIGLGVDYVHDDFMSGIFGLPFLDAAWMEKA
ncbi:MAG: ABC transporter substrate-binding protein [Anaerolineae bacterium]